MIIDFTEIAPANSAQGQQDDWEKFSRDFLVSQGYEIIEGPSRGADGGIDMKALQRVKDSDGTYKDFVWLVSCKHYAHSGKSVSDGDELNVLDRITQHSCDGFLGLYSQTASAGLSNRLNGLKGKVGIRIFDNAEIERKIVGFYHQENLFIRYFPESYKRWKEVYYHNEPVLLLEEYMKKHFPHEIAFFQRLFGSIANLIKPFRFHPSLEMALQDEGVECLLLQSLSEGYKGHWPYSQIEKTAETEAWSWDKLVSEEMQRKYGVQLGKPISLETIFSPQATWILYSNYLVWDSNALVYLENIFQQIKDILK